MTDLWIVGLPILGVDIANPVLLAVVILALTTDKPFVLSLSVIAGHTLAYLAAGYFLLYGVGEMIAEIFSPLQERMDAPLPSDYAVEGVVGAVLLVIALAWRVKPPKPSEKTSQQVQSGAFSGFLFGAITGFVGIPFAVPYFAFISQLMKVSEAQSLPALLVYNCAYALVFLLVPLSMGIFGKSAMPALQRISERVEKYSAYIMPVLLLVLGLILIVDAGYYFLQGKGLF